MAFELRITFTGLCLLVPETAASAVHVLLPKTSDHAHAGHSAATGMVEHHSARLLFDTAYTRQRSEKLDGSRVHVVLKERSLSFPALANDPIFTNLPHQIVNLSTLTGKPVPRLLLKGDPDHKLTGRVTVAAGRYETFEQGACWDLSEGSNRRMPHKLRWLINVPTGELNWELALLHESGTVPLPTLYPIEDRINLFVYHALPVDLPPAPEILPPAADTPAHHFAAYYDLLDQPQTRPLPKFKGESGCTGGMGVVSNESRGGSPFNCMLAQGDL